MSVEPSERDPPTHEERSRGADFNPTILILDDSVIARYISRVTLQSVGYTSVIEASSGQEALDLLSADDCRVDIVVCDLMMPGMDGIQFLRFAAELPRKPTLIFVSGGELELLQGAQDTARAREFAVLGVLQKPITAREISRIVGRHGDFCRRKFGNPTEELPLDIASGIRERQFILHYQPKVAVKDRALVGVEALVRWQHPQHGLLGPGRFIDEAEKSGQIVALTEQTMELAFAQVAAWSEQGFHPKVSVNLSPFMLDDLGLPDRVGDLAASYSIDPAQIVLEVTESGVFRDLANTLEILMRLRMKGFVLSIDDFGTGYSSMEQLRRVPFTELKIDRALVNGAAENEKARAILEGSVQLGRSLNMTIVAEGAETDEDWQLLRDADVDLGQGFFIAKPMAAEDVLAWGRQGSS